MPGRSPELVGEPILRATAERGAEVAGAGDARRLAAARPIDDRPWTLGDLAVEGSGRGDHEATVAAIERSVDVLEPDVVGSPVAAVAHQPLDAAAPGDVTAEVRRHLRLRELARLQLGIGLFLPVGHVELAACLSHRGSPRLHAWASGRIGAGQPSTPMRTSRVPASGTRKAPSSSASVATSLRSEGVSESNRPILSTPSPRFVSIRHVPRTKPSTRIEPRIQIPSLDLRSITRVRSSWERAMLS